MKNEKFEGETSQILLYSASKEKNPEQQKHINKEQIRGILINLVFFFLPVLAIISFGLYYLHLPSYWAYINYLVIISMVFVVMTYILSINKLCIRIFMDGMYYSINIFGKYVKFSDVEIYEISNKLAVIRWKGTTKYRLIRFDLFFDSDAMRAALERSNVKYIHSGYPFKQLYAKWKEEKKILKSQKMKK
jgi:hypothetical protein